MTLISSRSQASKNVWLRYTLPRSVVTVSTMIGGLVATSCSTVSVSGIMPTGVVACDNASSSSHPGWTCCGVNARASTTAASTDFAATGRSTAPHTRWVATSIIATSSTRPVEPSG